MFITFIYFIIVLLTYTVYQPHIPVETDLPSVSVFGLFVGLFFLFAVITRFLFLRLEKKLLGKTFSEADNLFQKTLHHLSILAIILFGADVYWLNCPLYLRGFGFFLQFPTVEAIIFLSLFIFYLAVVWHSAYDMHKKIYSSPMTRKEYVVSNVSFSAPVLLPWLVLSMTLDIINLLAFAPVRDFLATSYGQIGYFIFFLAIIVIWGPVMIQKFWGCKPLESGLHRHRIENILDRAELGYANILYWPVFGGRMITAGVMGLVRRFRYILVTEALLNHLNHEEIDSVIAHEIGHVKKKHLLFYMLFFLGFVLSFSLVEKLYDIARMFFVGNAAKNAPYLYDYIRSFLFEPSGTLPSLFLLFITICYFIIYFRYIFGYFMRNFERQADAYVFTLFPSAMPLISTFEKIILTSGQAPDKPNWHHFSISERIDFLKKCENDRSVIDVHESMLKKNMAIYGIVMFLIAALAIPLFIKWPGIEDKMGMKYAVYILEKEIDINDANPDMYAELGTLFFQKKDYRRSIRAYKKSLTLKPDHTHALNNLAWLYATCDNQMFRNHEQALILAGKAADIKTAPHILDTLAESYFVNNKFEQALNIGHKALKLAKEKLPSWSEYEEHVKKYESYAAKGRIPYPSTKEGWDGTQP